MKKEWVNINDHVRRLKKSGENTEVISPEIKPKKVKKVVKS